MCSCRQNHGSAERKEDVLHLQPSGENLTVKPASTGPMPFCSPIPITHSKFMKNYPFKISRHVLQAFAKSLAGTMVVALCGQALPSHASVLVNQWNNACAYRNKVPLCHQSASLIYGARSGKVLASFPLRWVRPRSLRKDNAPNTDTDL